MSFRFLDRGGTYSRVADPGWEDPLTGSFARGTGGRWNAPESFPVVYLNATVEVARANVWRKLSGLPYGPEDLAPESAPVLVLTEVPEDRFVDIVTDAGCNAAGLPSSYPWRDDGEPLPWPPCQAVGHRAWETGAPGIACRSAAPFPFTERHSPGEELAWFERDRKLEAFRRLKFDEWFWPREPEAPD